MQQLTREKAGDVVRAYGLHGSLNARYRDNGLLKRFPGREALDIYWDEEYPKGHDLLPGWPISRLKEEAALGLEEICIVRILGSDLEPRQKAGQTLENTRWLLQHEASFPDCRKLWVLNRIVDPAVRDELKSLVSHHHHGYMEIPFVPDEYRARSLLDYSDAQLRRYLGRRENCDKMSMVYTLALALLKAKVDYAIGLNAARNLALRHGRLYGRWVLPLDGNCYLEETGWNEFRTRTQAGLSGAENSAGNAIVSLGMARVNDNRQLESHHAGLELEYDQEPQLAFQRYADVQFDEHYVYGRRDKVELLWRLGMSGVWDNYRDVFFDPPRHPAGGLASLYAGPAGHLVRLASGTEHAKLTSGERHEMRLTAVIRYLESLDEQFEVAPSKRLDMGAFIQRLQRLF